MRRDRDRAKTGGLRAGDVGRGIADLRGCRCGPVAGPLAGQLEQCRPLLGFAAECSLSPRKEPLEPEAQQPGPGHRLGISGDECKPDPFGLQARESLGRTRSGLPPARICLHEELEVALGKRLAPSIEACIDRRVGEACGVKDVASDALRRQTTVFDVRERISGDVDAVDLVQRRGEGAAVERIVRQEERAVEVEERQHAAQMPSRSSIAASRRHFGRVLTLSSRKTCRPSSCSISGRARVPICLITEPPRPTTICF